MKIGIVGVGMVGGTLSYGFRRIGHEVFEHDIKRNTSLLDLIDTEILFICVPTPQAGDGSCDTSIVEDAVEDLASYGYRGLAVIKSTVTPGTTDRLAMQYLKLRLAFCPEFLRERCAYTDFVDQHDVCIIGAYGWGDAEQIKEAHGNLPKWFEFVTPLEAEMTKYFSNVFNAMRIVFANQFYDVCKAAGADYQKVKDAVTKRHNIGDYYLHCSPGFRAFGGNCLPKDTSAFASYVRKMGLGDLKLFDLIVEDNKRIKAQEAA